MEQKRPTENAPVGLLTDVVSGTRFVEMLISQHAVHLQALRDLYKRCVTGEGFPGSPLQESTQGLPGTHAILDRLGLIKHAEEAIEDPQKVLADMVDYLNCLETHSDCLDSTESTDTSEATLSGNPSPEFSTPMELVDSTMPSVACTWIETSDHHHQLYHAHDGSKPLQQQQQYPDISPAGNSDDACAIGNGNNADPSEVPWHYCAPQLRYIPAAGGIDAGCERTDLSTNVSWSPMTTNLSPSSYVPTSSRSDDSEESIYANDQPVFPGVQAYAHHFGNNGPLQRERQRQFRQSGDPVLLNVSTEDHCVYL